MCRYGHDFSDQVGERLRISLVYRLDGSTEVVEIAVGAIGIGQIGLLGFCPFWKRLVCCSGLSGLVHKRIPFLEFGSDCSRSRVASRMLLVPMAHLIKSRLFVTGLWLGGFLGSLH